MKKILKATAALLAAISASCTSYEIDMPENPAPPAEGPEVPVNVIYEANPRFFGEDGCLGKLTVRVPAISEMGCDILWVMPVCTPGELKAIGSPYCIRDFKQINPRYGTMADFKALVAAAHAQGMKVVLDWIANHTSWDNPWITSHPDRYKKDGAGNIVSPDNWPDVAQLDYNNPATAEAMEDAMTYWVTEGGVDGFRCDFAEGVPHEFWAKVIADLRAARPGLIMIAEASDYSFYDDGFDMIYDWNSSRAISAAFQGGKASEVVTEAADALVKVPEGKSILRYVFNHDVAAENSIDRMYGSVDAIPAAYVLAAMFNGTPMIYSSMDVEGLSGRLSFFDYRTLDFSAKLTAEYRAVNDAFIRSAEVRRGELAGYSTSSVVCFTRSIPGRSMLVAVNTTGSDQTLKTPIELAGTEMTDLISGHTLTLPVTLTLGAYGYVIYMN